MDALFGNAFAIAQVDLVELGYLGSPLEKAEMLARRRIIERALHGGRDSDRVDCLDEEFPAEEDRKPLADNYPGNPSLDFHG